MTAPIAVLPLYRHPTMTVLIDDDRSSLAVLQHQIDSSVAKKTFNMARSALAWITNAFGAAARIGAAVEVHVDGMAWNDTSTELRQIYRYVGDPQRFTLPSVVVIDYSMPDMDGIAFCQAVAQYPCRKILFSSLANDKVGINAFNRGLINRFIRKQDADALDQLEAAIEELQLDYFIDRSRASAQLLDQRVFGFLNDLAVSQLVASLCDRYGFVEYYLFTNPSGFLCFDADGNPTLLTIQNDYAIETHIARLVSEGVQSSAIEEMRARSVVPFFHTNDGMWQRSLGADVGLFCKAAQVCHGEGESYYWALFDLPEQYRHGTPYSHAQFLRQHVPTGS